MGRFYCVVCGSPRVGEPAYVRKGPTPNKVCEACMGEEEVSE